MASNRKDILLDLLRTMASHWGHDEVQAALDHLRNLQNDAAVAEPRQAGQQRSREKRSSGRSSRPNAVDQVLELEISAEQRDVLIDIAKKFDNREILPTSSDVRTFLAMVGEDTGVANLRSEAFRKILPVVFRFPSESLRQLEQVSTQSGPARLGPLAEAIRSAGDALRGRASASTDVDSEPQVTNKDP